MLGGYAGVNAPDPDARDPVKQPSILSGDLAGDDAPGFVNNGENAYNVVLMIECSEATLLDGFTVEGGNADADRLSPAFLCAGLYVDGEAPTVSNCRFSGCAAAIAGGAVGFNYSSHGRVIGCDFTHNRMPGGFIPGFGGGGALWIAFDSIVSVDRCAFAGNAALVEGGAVWNTPGFSGGTICDCLFVGNSAPQGGAVRNIASANLSLVNCTFAGNSADSGGAVSEQPASHTSVANCVLWGNTPGQLAGTPDVAYSCIQEGFAGPGNIAADPRFVDAPGGDYRLSSPGSACIDAGANPLVPPGVTADLDGRPRFADDPATPDTGLGTAPIVDMGAFEFQGCYADLDGDGSLTLFDFLVFVNAFNAHGPAADCDHNGAHDLFDFLCYVNAFNEDCP